MKLKLKNLSHTNLDRVTWLNKGKNVLVNEQAWVEFTIGGYQDKILYDVVPMDDFYLLLGRPWQYDIDVVHHRNRNMYTFKKDDHF